MTGSAPPRRSQTSLLVENARLRAENARLEARLSELETLASQLATKLEAALAELERLKGSGPPRTAPFSRGQRKPDPQKPGRKKGQGLFRYRQPLAPGASATAPEDADPADPATVEVPVTEDRCPCGGTLEADGFETVSNTEIPPTPEPVVRTYRVEKCRCRQCGRSVRGKHPDVAADQTGATAHRLGPRAYASAHLLHYDLGVTVRKVPAVLWLLNGLPVTQGAITQDALRRTAGKLGQAYALLRTGIAKAAQINTDDTGWSIHGAQAFLMAFVAADCEVFQIRRQHRNEEVREVIPSDYAGVMGTDRGSSYKAKELERVRQQKCLSHLLRNISDVLQYQVGESRKFGEVLQGLLREALALWRRYHQGQEAEFAAKREDLRRRLLDHLRERELPERANQRLLNGIGWHAEQGNLLRFLDDPRVEPTNNVAERALRPAVIARKVSQCSKTEGGANAHSAFLSVIRTLRRRGVPSLVEALVQVFETGEVRAPG